MADFVSAQTGARQTLMATTGHQIRCKRGRGTQAAHVVIGCRCGAPARVSADGVCDWWAIYNHLTHNPAAGDFTPLDEATGRRVAVS